MTITDIFKDITKQLAVGAGVPTCNNWAIQRGDGNIYDGNESDGAHLGINQQDAPNGYIRVLSQLDFSTQNIGSCRNLVEASLEFALVTWAQTNQPPTQLMDTALYNIAKTKIRPNGYNHPNIDIERASFIYDEIYSEETGAAVTTPPNGLVLAKVVFTVRVNVAFCDLSLPACYLPIAMPAIVFDADALIYIAALESEGYTPTQPERIAINKCFVGLKDAGFYTRLYAFWPMIGGTAQTHKFNAKNPVDTDAAFRLNYFGGWVHSSTGAKPNGINAYANTHFIPATHAAPDSLVIGYYSGTQSTGVFAEMGVTGVGATVGVGQLIIAPNIAGTAFRSVNTTGNAANAATIATTGIFTASRNDAADFRLHRNTAMIFNDTGLPNTASDKKAYLGARNTNDTSFVSTDRECRAAFICDGLSEAETNAINAIFITLETDLGRP